MHYHDDDRLHGSLEAKDAPNRRVVEHRPDVNAKVASMARLGGLQHRYGWRQAAYSREEHFQTGSNIASLRKSTVDGSGAGEMVPATFRRP